MKKEVQINLNGTEIINRPISGYYPYSMVRILKEFYYNYHEIGLSLVELKKKFLNTMSRNTLQEGVLKMKELGYIELVIKNVGPTKRRKYYKITEKGAVFWENLDKR